LRIAGTGIDIIEISRIEDALDRHGARFLDRVFTPAESEYCRSQAAPAQHLAGRFAVKEAVLKALGTGWSGRMRWRDVEVKRGASGEPSAELHGAAARRAAEMGIVKVHVSISHSGRHAVAHAIAEARSA